MNGKKSHDIEVLTIGKLGWPGLQNFEPIFEEIKVYY